MTIFCYSASPASGAQYAVPQAFEKASPAVARSGAPASRGCTLKRGSLVVKSGTEYRIASISKTGVVKLNTLAGCFAMFSHVSACK